MNERPTATEPLLITLRDDLRVPRFPEPGRFQIELRRTRCSCPPLCHPLAKDALRVEDQHQGERNQVAQMLQTAREKAEA